MDNVAVLPQTARPGDNVHTKDSILTVAQEIPVGHKIALKKIFAGEMVVKYGTAIGQASCDILPGQWVHTHNVKDITEELCNQYARDYRLKVRGGNHCE